MNTNTRIALTNLGAYNEGTLRYVWLSLPCTEDDLDGAKKDIGIDGKRYEEWFISDSESDLVSLSIGEYEDIEDLSDLIEQIEYLDDCEAEKLQAILEADGNSPEDVIDELDDCVFLPNVSDDEELGEYCAEVNCLFDGVSNTLQTYFDYEAYGRDVRLEEGGSYTHFGYVATL